MVITIAVFILILGLLVFVHELGHFSVARMRGVAVREFGFGFPPRICGVRKDLETGKYKFFWRLDKEEEESKRKEIEAEENKKKGIESAAAEEEKAPENTIYSLNWIPLGGFVNIYGEQGEGRGEGKSFVSKKIWERFLILAAGVFMNFVLGAALFSLGYAIGLPSSETPENKALLSDVSVQIAAVSPGSPAEIAGLEMGMKILGARVLTGSMVEFSEVEDFQSFVSLHKGENIILRVIYSQQEVEKVVVPRINPPENEGPIGVMLTKAGILKYPWYKAPYYGARDTVYLAGAIIEGFYLLLKNLILHGSLIFDVSGPVGIAKFTGKIVNLGFLYLIQFAAFLSINLGIINFLPIPALDGGRVLFLLIEKIKGSPVPQKFENYIHAAGFALLIMLMVLITVRDVIKLF